EAVLDLALGAARAADDRRRVTAVLGAAPQAALFGPSPVARAGGRCLDVVRLLRITTASPSVEATSMRCQAVLEALRGRFDVSRSMLASARASLEELGLRHGLLETDLFTGMVELIAGDAAAAVAPLRSAYEGLDTLGVGADAGQAAALLATALLDQGDFDAAELMAGESEALAGQNLKTGIAWRTAKAAVLAARGDLKAAVSLADAAVEIAAATDLILDHADACVVLADLRGQAGDATGARAARAEALRLYEAKGATVPARRLSTTDDSAPPVAMPVREASALLVPDRDPSETRAARAENEATRRIEEHLALLLAVRIDEAYDVMRNDVVRVDRQPAVSFPTLTGVEALRATMDSGIAVGFHHVAKEPVAVRGGRLCLVRSVATARGFENVSLDIWEFDANGLCFYQALYGDADLAAAIDELDERYAAGEGAAHANAIRLAREFRQATVAWDFERIRATMTDDATVVDHRELAWGSIGRDEYLALQQGYAESFGFGRLYFVARTLHLAGDAVLATLEYRGETPDGTAAEWVSHTVLEHDGARFARIEMFSEVDFDAALSRFEELGAPRSTGVLGNAASRAAYDFAALATRGDVDGLRARLSDRFTRDDRRRVTGQGMVPGRDAMLDNLGILFELGIAVTVKEVIATRGERLALTAIHFEAEGFRTDVLELVGVDASGAHVSLHDFDEDDLTSAFAELDALHLVGEGASDDLRKSRVGNEAWHVAMHFVDQLNARDFDAARRLVADDFTRLDRRHGVSAPTADGPDAFLGAAQAWYDVGFDEFVAEAVAVRGDTLVLQRLACRATDGREVSFLAVYEIDADRKLVGGVHFDDDDVVSAIDELDDRYLAGEGAEHAPVLIPCRRFREASRRGDFDAVQALLAADFAFRDHRQLGFGAGGRDHYLAASRTRTEVGSDRGIVHRTVQVVGSALLMRLDEQTRSPAGNDDEWSAYLVLAVGPSGLITAAEWFADECFEDAQARLQELGAPARASSVLDNAALGAEVAFTDALDEYLRGGDLSAMTALADVTAPEFVLEDRRSIVAMPDQHRAGIIDVVATMRAQGYVRASGVPIAVRGDRLALTARMIGTDAGDETRSLSLAEVDEAGRFLRACLFDAEDLDDAHAELDRRYFTGEGATHQRVLRACGRFSIASAGDDFDRMRTLLADDFVVADHRQLGFGEGDVEYFVEMSATRNQVSSDGGMVNRTLEITGRTMLVVSEAHRISDDGAEYVTVMCIVFDVDPSDRIRRAEYYDEDQYDRAVARLHQLGGQDTGSGSGPEIENAASRTNRKLLALINAADWDGAGAMDAISEHVVRYDRRKLVAAPPIEGRDAFGRNAVGFLDVFDSVEPEVVAVRGDRLALIRLHFGREPDFVLPLLCLYEFDEDGRLAWEADYDDEDLDAALSELDERYLDGEGAPHERLLRICGSFARTSRQDDAEAIRELLAPDFTFLDRTPIGFGEGDREYYVTLGRSRRAVTTDVAVINRLLHVQGHALLTVIEARFVTDAGSEYSSAVCMVIAVDESDRVTRIELFPEDEYADAVARLHELGASRPSA
ncbi:MAG: hypothetical protein ABJC79_04525, partial [Acidimicrobiia bacterium]